MRKISRTSFSLEVLGDRATLLNLSEHRVDNSAQLRRLKEKLHDVMDNELTQCQKTAVEEYFFNNRSMTEIAEELGVNKSTVSRHLKRAKEKLGQALKYGLQRY